jgi:Flp pilus assembly protein TadG
MRPEVSRRRQAGQSMVEFALVGFMFFVVVLGVMDFGYFYSGKVSATAAIRVAARYGAVHPVAWDNASNPSPNSIQGKLKLTAVPAIINNNDAHVTISYLRPGTLAAGTICGQYSAATNAFVGATGSDNVGNCPIAGNLVEVNAIYNYQWITPMLKAAFSNLTITGQADEYIEG